MTDLALMSPAEAEARIAELFAGNGQCAVFVREDRVFGDDGWLALGAISLGATDQDAAELTPRVRSGAFEWRLPSVQEAP